MTRQKNNQNDACLKFYDVARPLYLETYVSSFSLLAGLLQVRDDMNCGHDEIPDNAILYSPLRSHLMWYSTMTTWNAKLLTLYMG